MRRGVLGHLQAVYGALAGIDGLEEHLYPFNVGVDNLWLAVLESTIKGSDIVQASLRNNSYVLLD